MRILPQRKEPTIPILMYHSISEDMQHGIHPYYQTATSPRVFAEHMKFLYENNYKVINLDQAVKIFKSKETPHRSGLSNKLFNQSRNKLLFSNQQIKYLVLTFDDGYQDFYTEAFPVLQSYNYPATVFLPTGLINNRKGLKGKSHLNWNQILELSNNGITFGSHTVSHPQLKFLKKENIELEIRQSKEVIEDNLGKPVESFSYPFAFPDEDKEFTEYLRGLLQKYRYKHGVSTRIGTTSKKNDIYFMKRIPINSCDDIPLFKTKLEGGYDWLRMPQNLYKFLKHRSGSNNV